MTDSTLFTDDFKVAPYWLDHISAVEGLSPALPPQADIAIIGSGYTGLNAALVAQRGGRQVVVLEAGMPGFGCSTRNGGQISANVKPELSTLTKDYGSQAARAILDESQASLAWIKSSIAAENIDCDYRECGLFNGAHTTGQFDAMCKDAESLPHEGISAVVIPKAEQHTELGTDFYEGGLLFPKHASLHAAKYHQGLLQRCIDAGVVVVPYCKVTALSASGDGTKLETTLGPIEANDTLVATNGYTGNTTPWQQRRVIPISSSIIATEPLPQPLIDELIPNDRTITDSRRVVFYYRTSPDRKRLLFGGRVAAGDIEPTESATRLHQEMVRIFPQVAQTKISHTWSGTVAYTFDKLPHAGVQDGVYFAMGYCGSGVAMAGYLGTKMGYRLLGSEGHTVFAEIPFKTRPLYSGKPWFLPAVVAGYRWLDRRECRT